MAVRCTFCANLSIPYLVDLAKEEFDSKVFPCTAYYKHHDSFDALENSAKEGCDLCQLIIKCFKEAPEDELMWVGTRNGLKSVDVDQSMYTRAKALEVSDVKMAIDSSETWTSQKLDDVQILDTLMVLVGPNYERRDPDGPEEESYVENWVPVLPLTLTAPRGKEGHIDDFQIGRSQVESILASPVNFKIARGWLDECRARHHNCLSSNPPKLPTRVVDVGVGTDSKTAKIFLTQGLEADYVALSHCWGGDIDIKLTTRNIVPFQASLPYESLPANFQDAIVITRELGVRYLWIDSLCIIQDSALDWENESRKMGRVYGDSALTISAVAASGSNVGILVPSSEAAHQAKSQPSLLLPIHPVEHPIFGTVQVEHRGLEEEDLCDLHIRGPLNKRGWTLQESILSPRILFYGLRQIYWKCPERYASADGLYRHARGPMDLFREISRQVHTERLLHPSMLTNGDTLSTEGRDRLLADYYKLVNEYTGRQLTFGSDKFLAFSGLARRLSPLLGEYLAGIWLSDWRRGILWYPEGRFCIHSRTPFRAPSWSWAVTNQRVLFDYSLEEQPCPYHHVEAQLIDSKVIPWNTSDAFGKIESGYLVIKGLTVPLIRSSQNAKLSVPSWAHFDEPDKLDRVQDEDESGLCGIMPLKDSDRGGAYTMLAIPYSRGMDSEGYDEFEIDYAAFSENEYCLVLINVDDDAAKEADGRRRNVRCLIIKPLDTGTDSAFERVGLAFLDPKSCGIASWESRVVTLF